MKRFALVALVAAMLFSVVTSASATELKVRGNLDVYGMWSANLYDFDSDIGDADNYTTTQRMRAYFDYVANENLKAVLGLEIDTIWGQGDADWGTDLNTNDIEIKHAYMSFTLPDTTVNVQAGLQYVALPSVFGNPVFDDDAPAITVSAQITDMVGVTVGYTRGVDGYNNFSDPKEYDDDDEWTGDYLVVDKDDVDMAFIAAPMSFDGFALAPYFAYAWLGQNALADTATDDATVWVLGANAELTMFDPLTIAADLIYGQSDWEFEGEDVDSDGWYAALAASYKMDFMTATLFGTYFTGLDDDEDDLGMLPQLAEGWGLTPYIGGVRAFSTSWDTFSGVDNACWVAGVKLAKITFIDKLSHDLTIAYAQGTSDEDADIYFDEKDSAWEVYMVNKYMIYENLAAINELGFFAPDLDDSEEDNSYFATIGFQYKF